MSKNSLCFWLYITRTAMLAFVFPPQEWVLSAAGARALSPEVLAQELVLVLAVGLGNFEIVAVLSVDLVPFAVQVGNIEVNADFLGANGKHPFARSYAVTVPSSAAHMGFATLLLDGLGSSAAAGNLLHPE